MSRASRAGLRGSPYGGEGSDAVNVGAGGVQTGTHGVGEIVLGGEVTTPAGSPPPVPSGISRR